MTTNANSHQAPTIRRGHLYLVPPLANPHRTTNRTPAKNKLATNTQNATKTNTKAPR